MKMLFKCADRYMEKSDWRDIALIKLCLCSIGIMLGVFIPREKRSFALGAAFVVFVCTYFPLMTKFFGVCHEVINEK